MEDPGLLAGGCSRVRDGWHGWRACCSYQGHLMPSSTLANRDHPQPESVIRDPTVAPAAPLETEPGSSTGLCLVPASVFSLLKRSHASQNHPQLPVLVGDRAFLAHFQKPRLASTTFPLSQPFLASATAVPCPLLCLVRRRDPVSLKDGLTFHPTQICLS